MGKDVNSKVKNIKETNLNDKLDDKEEVDIEIQSVKDKTPRSHVEMIRQRKAFRQQQQENKRNLELAEARRQVYEDKKRLLAKIEIPLDKENSVLSFQVESEKDSVERSNRSYQINEMRKRKSKDLERIESDQFEALPEAHQVTMEERKRLAENYTPFLYAT